MIGVVDVEVQAKNPNLPLWPLRAYVNSPTSLRLRNVPRKIGNWRITSVNFQVTYPDGAIASADCVLVGGVWVGTVAGTPTPGKSDFGYAIYASGIDEHGNPVTGYCLGKGDVEILDDQGEVTPSEHATYTKLLSAEPADPQDGNIWQVSGMYYIQQFGQTWTIGDDSEVIGELSAKVDEKADLSAIHGDYIEDADGNKIEADLNYTILTNQNWHLFYDNVEYVLSGTRINSHYRPSNPQEGDLGWTIGYTEGDGWAVVKDAYSNGIWRTVDLFVPMEQTEDATALEFGSGYAEWEEVFATGKLAKESDLPTKTSELSNDSGFIEQNGMAVIHDLTCDQLVANQAYIAGYVTESDLSSKADLSAVPTKTSDLSNDSGFITSAQVPTPDKIEDLSANVIYANRTVQYIEEVANWTDVNYPESPLNWDADNNWWMANISPSLIMKLQFNSGTWSLEIGKNIGGEWIIESDLVQDTQEATELDFIISGAFHRLDKGVQQIQATGELALKSYVDGLVGDIDSVLDAINGEVI